MKALNSIISFITDKDKVVNPSHKNLHFQKDRQQKTFLGGIITIGVTLFVLSIAYVRGNQMINFSDPEMTSVERKMD